MMVEAGGTEGSFEKYADGAPKVTEEVLAAGLEASKTWIRESINLQRELVADFVAARGPIKPIEYKTFADYQRRRLRRASRRSAPARSTAANVQTAKAERNAALDAAAAAIIDQLVGRVPRAHRRDQGRRSGRSRRSSCASASSRRASASTAAAPRTSVR